MTDSPDLEKDRWRKRLSKERAFEPEFATLSEAGWRNILKGSRRVTSSNHDTVLSIDWPHYCAWATEACGGANGWCYTFQGRQATQQHNRHAAMVDVLATRFPLLFGERVALEVQKAVALGLIPYSNIRFSGSGEMAERHVAAMRAVVSSGVHAWGFTRNIRLACELRSFGAFAIYSCDFSTDPAQLQQAQEAALPLAYSSRGAFDKPPSNTLVTFPVHKVGRVREVCEAPSLCPKVVSEFLHEYRPPSFCQAHCRRCHRGAL